MSEYPLRCKCRREAPTSLRCARCSVPICPDCSVNVPVGMICRDCARGARSPLYQVSVGSFAAASAASLAVAAFGGWVLASVGMGFGFFGLWFGFLYGLMVGEVGLRVTGRKRGTQMEILAGVSAVLGIVAGLLIETVLHPEAPYLRMHLINPMTYVMVIVAAAAAVGRIRNI